MSYIFENHSMAKTGVNILFKNLFKIFFQKMIKTNLVVILFSAASQRHKTYHFWINKSTARCRAYFVTKNVQMFAKCLKNLHKPFIYELWYWIKHKFYLRGKTSIFSSISPDSQTVPISPDSQTVPISIFCFEKLYLDRFKKLQLSNPYCLKLYKKCYEGVT